MALCRLCHKDRELRNSHIVPEFLYGDLYNSKHKMMGIHGRGAKGWSALQKGVREHLFCETCEQYFNEHFEKPFLSHWVTNFPLPDPWQGEEMRWITVPYNAFKLFHLCVLFRAGVSTLPMFSEVSLGRHEECLRNMLLAKDAGDDTRYPVCGYAVVHHRSRRIIQMVSKAIVKRFGGRRCYGMMYGGVQWWVCVASDTNRDFQQGALRLDGRMPFISVLWNEVSVVQEASRALRRADT